MRSILWFRGLFRFGLSWVTVARGLLLILAPTFHDGHALQGDEASWLAVRKDQGRQWNIYDWKGELSCTLEGEEESWLSLSGPLLELRCRNYTAYYEPESGTCVFRTWFSLGDRGGEAQEPAG